MEINVKLAESLINAFDNEETGIILWDQSDNILYRNKNISERFIKLKPSEFHIISSSAILEICKEHTEEAYKKSKTKSLSETVSIELLVGFLKPNFFVVKFLSMLNDVPVNAATPKGFSYKFSRLFSNLDLSLLNVSI